MTKTIVEMLVGSFQMFMYGVTLSFIIHTVSGKTYMVWMAPYNLVPGSSLKVNASTSLPALALALQEIYNQGILPKDSVR